MLVEGLMNNLIFLCGISIDDLVRSQALDTPPQEKLEIPLEVGSRARSGFSSMSGIVDD